MLFRSCNCWIGPNTFCEPIVCHSQLMRIAPQRLISAGLCQDRAIRSKHDIAGQRANVEAPRKLLLLIEVDFDADNSVPQLLHHRRIAERLAFHAFAGQTPIGVEVNEQRLVQTFGFGTRLCEIVMPAPGHRLRVIGDSAKGGKENDSNNDYGEDDCGDPPQPSRLTR